MPARATPASLNATPATTATSSNVPSPRFWNNWFGCVSLVTNKSIHPSPSTSNIVADSALADGLLIPAVTVTSSNVPSPRFRYNTEL